MHLAEGTLPLTQALVWSLPAAGAVAWSIAGHRAASTPKPSSDGHRALLATAIPLLFAATLLPLPVPVMGATSHICLTPLLALLLGVRAVIWPTAFVLLLQALFFAHGGLTTLGANVLTLGVLGPTVAVLVAGGLRRLGLRPALVIGIACTVGDLAVYVGDACLLAVGLASQVAPATTWITVVVGFLPVQGPLAVLEGVLSAWIFGLLVRRRPELVPRRLWLAVAAVLLVGCGYEGIDGSVFGAVAEGAGHAPQASLVDLSEGELGLAMNILVLFSLGFLAGRGFERLRSRSPGDASTCSQSTLSPGEE